MEIIYREMCPSDIETAIKLWENEPFLGITDADTTDRLTKYINDNIRCCFVAEYNNEIVGPILGGTDSRRGFLNHLFVKPEYRQYGIASTLVKMSEEGLQQYPPRRSYVFVYKENIIGIKFWKTNGYKIDDSFIVMKKNLE